MTEPALRVDEVDGVFVVSGEIDAHTYTILDRALEGGGPVTQVDLGAVTFIDSSGLRVLVRHHQDRQRNGGRLDIHSPSRAVQRLLEISGLTGQLNVVVP